MRIHTDILTPDDLYAAAKAAEVRVEAVSTHRSTARGHALDFILSGHGRSRGQYGNLDYTAASWDDYGIALAELFRRDPRAVVGTPGRPTYDGAADFHAETAYRYETLTPAEAHHTHRRNYGPGWRSDVYQTPTGRTLLPCRKCDAYI